MKLTLITLLLFLGVKGITQEIPNDRSKWLPLNTYGVVYPRLGVTGVFQIPEYVDTPTIAPSKRSDWKNSIGRRTIDNKVYIYDGTKWNSLSSGGGIGSESDPIFSASAAFSITNTNKTNWNTAFGWGNHATFGYLTSVSGDARYYTKGQVDALVGGGGGGVAGVSSFNSRSGVVVPQLSDYSSFYAALSHQHDTATAVTGYATKGYSLNLANGKVDKVTGKQLSTEDYTTAEKTKLTGVASGATNVTNTNQLTNGADFATVAQVNADTTIVGARLSSNINTTNTTVSNKVDKVNGKQLSTEDYTTPEKTKLAGVAIGATNVTNTNQLTNGAGFATTTLVNSDTTIIGARLTANTNATNSNLSVEVTNRINADATKLNIADTANLKPRLTAGTNVTLTGTYPNITIASTGGGGGGTTYTAVSPIRITGSVIDLDPTYTEDITTSTVTFTNKRIVPRVQSLASASTVTPNSDNDDAVKVTTLASALAFVNPNGTPTAMQDIWIKVKDNGVARALSYGTQYRAVGVTLPTTTVINKWLYLHMIWSGDDSFWDVVDVKQQ